MTARAQASPPGRGQFLHSVAWNWLSVGLGLASSLVLAPYVIRKLGDDNFGLWALTLTLVEYYWLVDLGLRSAAVRYAAYHHALGEHARVNEIINTSLCYSVAIAPVLIGGTWLAAPLLISWGDIGHPLFTQLLLIVVGCWALVGILSIFTSCLEGFQRFDLTSQASILALALRTTLAFLLLYAGYGVIELAYVTCGAQILLHLISYLRLRGVFPQMALSLRRGSLSTLRTMLGYGVHSVVASLGQRILNSVPPLLIGYFLPLRFVGYYSAPVRLLDYTVEAVGRVGNVTNPRAASLVAAGRREDVLHLCVLVNRYCLLLFLPLTLYLGFYARPLLSVWTTPQFGAMAAGVLVALLPGVTTGNAAQYNTMSALFGMGRHQTFSRLLLAEALLSMAGMCFVLPRYGIVGAAWTASLLMLVNRGLISGWLLTRELGAGYWSFMGRVYAPLALSLPVGAWLYLLRRYIPGADWPQLILAGCLMMLVYLPLAVLLIEPTHRSLLVGFIRSRWKALQAAGSR